MTRYRQTIYWLLFCLLTFAGSSVLVLGGENNGFDLSNSLVPEREIFHGGPSKDAIPAIDVPKFVSAQQAHWLQPEHRVLGIESAGLARAYPVSILNWHEIINDGSGRDGLVITYCPLCGSGVAFSSTVLGRKLNFGVSGLLYNSDVLLYDRETDSLWSQLMRKAISGPMRGMQLKMLPLEHTSWKRWRSMHPDTLVLSTDTGYLRDYQADPYAGYAQDKELYFPIANLDPRYHPKQQTLGLEIDGRFKAYPFVELDKAGGRVSDSLAGQALTVSYDRESRSAWVKDGSGRTLATVTTFWFAWMAFHPESKVFTAP